MIFLRQSTAVVVQMGPYLDKTDGVTLKADGTTITDIDHATTGIFLSKNGGDAAIRHQAVTASVADDYGMMRVTLDATDTNTLGTLRMSFAKAATYLPVWQDFMVVPANVWDSMFGADLLQVDTTQIEGGDATDALEAAVTAIIDAANTELASIPTTTAGLRLMLQFLFEYFRNARTETASAESLKKEDGTTELGSRTLGDDGTTFSRGELSS